MKTDSKKLFVKAERAIKAAETLAVEDDCNEFAVGRAYYAMFYVAEALLNEKGLHFRKHGGVQAAYGEQFAKTGLLDAKYHRWLINAFDRRNVGDYGLAETFTSREVKESIDQAREFINAAHDFLNSLEAK